MLKDQQSGSGYHGKCHPNTLISKWPRNISSHKRHPQWRGQWWNQLPFYYSWCVLTRSHEEVNPLATCGGPTHLGVLTFASFTQMKSLYESKQPKQVLHRAAPEGANHCLSLVGTPKGNIYLTEKMDEAGDGFQGTPADGQLWCWRWPEGGSTAQLNCHGPLHQEEGEVGWGSLWCSSGAEEEEVMKLD